MVSINGSGMLASSAGLGLIAGLTASIEPLSILLIKKSLDFVAAGGSTDGVNASCCFVIQSYVLVRSLTLFYILK